MEFPNLDNLGSPDFCPLYSAWLRDNEGIHKIFGAFLQCASYWRWLDCNPGCSLLSRKYRGVATQMRSDVNSWFDSAFCSLRALDRKYLRLEKMRINHDRMAQCTEPEISLRSIEIVGELKGNIDDYLDLLFSSRPDFCKLLHGLRRRSYDGCADHYFYIISKFLLEAGHELAYNITVSVVVLSIVYRYLLGYVDRGGTKTYNPGSIEFRDTFVSLLLFRGAYVWIKFRDVNPKGVKRVPKRDKFNKVIEGEYYDKYESRLKPPNERDYLHLGVYDKAQHAVLVRQIGMSFYRNDVKREVALEDGSLFPIPEMSEQERSLCGEEKRKWVSEKAKAVFKEIQEKNEKIREENASRTPPSEDQVEARGCSSPADQSGIALLASASANIPDAFSVELFRLAEKHGPLESGDGETLDYFTFEEIWEAPLPQEIVNEQLAEERQKNRRLEEKCSGLEEKCSGLEEKYSGLKEEFSKLRQEISELQQQQNKRLKTA